MSALRPIAACAGLLLGACTASVALDAAPVCAGRPADERAVLQKVAALPVSTWSYTFAPRERHLGPMAQDFHAAFGGASERRYDPADAHAVSFAALKALVQLSDAQEARIRQLEEDNRRLEAALAARGR